MDLSSLDLTTIYYKKTKEKGTGSKRMGHTYLSCRSAASLKWHRVAVLDMKTKKN